LLFYNKIRLYFADLKKYGPLPHKSRFLSETKKKTRLKVGTKDQGRCPINRREATWDKLRSLVARQAT
jgi:hypothetical protein